MYFPREMRTEILEEPGRNLVSIDLVSMAGSTEAVSRHLRSGFSLRHQFCALDIRPIIVSRSCEAAFPLQAPYFKAVGHARATPLIIGHLGANP